MHTFGLSRRAWGIGALLRSSSSRSGFRPAPSSSAGLGAAGDRKHESGGGVAAPVAASAGSAWYYLGRQKGGKVLGFLCRLSLEPDSVSDTENVFHRNGLAHCCWPNFVPGFSTVAPPCRHCQYARHDPFILYDLGGTLIWAAVSRSRRVVASNQLEQLIGPFDQAGGVTMLVILLLGLAGFGIGYSLSPAEGFLQASAAWRKIPVE